MKLRNILVLTIFVTLISCTKKDNSLQIEGQYLSAENGNLFPVMMYTKQGQVTNSSTIQEFLQRKGVLNEFSFNYGSTPIADSLLEITISNNNMVTVLTNSSSTLHIGEIVKQTSSELVISEMDSTEYLISDNENRCDDLSMEIQAVNPEKKYYPLPFLSGFNGLYKFRPTYPVTIKNGQLLFPLMTFVTDVSNGSSSQCLNYVENEWNYFNPDITGQLQIGDTIVYQMKELTLIKQ